MSRTMTCGVHACEIWKAAIPPSTRYARQP
jgi:hypothetical protein